MGTQWEILDMKNRRRFDMDKLYVAGVAKVVAPMTPEDVLIAYSKANADRYGQGACADDHREIAARLWAFCDVSGWSIRMVNDLGYDDDRDLDWSEWPTVDGRCGGKFDADPCAVETVEATSRARVALRLT